MQNTSKTYHYSLFLCNLCLEEKISILKEKNNCLLNKRSEIVSACQHKSRFQVNNLNKERNACYSALSIKEARTFSKFVYHLKIPSG